MLIDKMYSDFMLIFAGVHPVKTSSGWLYVYDGDRLKAIPSSALPGMGTGGMVGGTPIVNLELTPHHKKFKWFTVGGTPIKISNWDDEIIKIAEKFAKTL